MSHKIRVLYLSYDGMTDPLGQSQVIPYLKLLTRHNIQFDLISFEKPDLYNKDKEYVKQLIGNDDISWHPLMYHKSPPVLSTLGDIQRGWKLIRQLFSKKHYDIVHCRGYITAVLGLRCQNTFGTRFLFDMRGWWADEKKESGLWNGVIYRPVYKYFKKLEKKCFTKADGVVSLTHSGKEEISRLGYRSQHDIHVIPTCVNLSLFSRFDPEMRRKIRTELTIPADIPVLLYSGSVGGYYRVDYMVKAFRILKKTRPDACFIFLTRSDKEQILSELRAQGIDEKDIRLFASDFKDVHKYLMAADYGLIIYEPLYSSIGRSPTKLGEYWACGLPVLTMRNAGDLDYLFEKYPNGGRQVADFSDHEFESQWQIMLNSNYDPAELREFSFDYYDLAKGVESYKLLYEGLIK